MESEDLPRERSPAFRDELSRDSEQGESPHSSPPRRSSSGPPYRRNSDNGSKSFKFSSRGSFRFRGSFSSQYRRGSTFVSRRGVRGRGRSSFNRVVTRSPIVSREVGFRDREYDFGDREVGYREREHGFRERDDRYRQREENIRDQDSGFRGRDRGFRGSRGSFRRPRRGFISKFRGRGRPEYSDSRERHSYSSSSYGGHYPLSRELPARTIDYNRPHRSDSYGGVSSKSYRNSGYDTDLHVDGPALTRSQYSLNGRDYSNSSRGFSSSRDYYSSRSSDGMSRYNREERFPRESVTVTYSGSREYRSSPPRRDVDHPSSRDYDSGRISYDSYARGRRDNPRGGGYSNRGHSLSGGSRSYSSYERRDDHPHDVAPPRRLSSREFDGAPPMKRNRGLPPKRSSPSFSYKTRGGGGGNAPFGRH